jgi:putative SOS response-associated peptidase YedK
LETAAIVTTQANRTLAPIHERMPVVVPEQAFGLWLDATAVDPQAAAALIAPASDGLLEAFPVSPAVNRVANDNPALIEPIAVVAAAPAKSADKRPGKRKGSAKPDDGQASMF